MDICCNKQVAQAWQAYIHGLPHCAHRYLSRDRNIVQFYGACVQSSSMLLVAELMEVRAEDWRPYDPAVQAMSRYLRHALRLLQGGDLRSALNFDKTGRFSWWQQGVLV
jgi:hypothetical protein